MLQRIRPGAALALLAALLVLGSGWPLGGAVSQAAAPAGLASVAPQGPSIGRQSRLPIVPTGEPGFVRNPLRDPQPDNAAGRLLTGLKFIGTTAYARSEDDVREIANTGADGIRLYFSWDEVQNKDGSLRSFEDRSSSWPWIDAVILWAKRHGIAVILDVHHYDGIDGPLYTGASYQERYFALWEAIASRYRNVSKQVLVGYEILNEPRPSSGGSETSPAAANLWNQLAARTVARIRAIDDRPIVIDAAHYSNTDMLKYLRVLPDPDIVYAFHWYHPFPFTLQGDYHPDNRWHNCQTYVFSYPGSYNNCAGFDSGYWNKNRIEATLGVDVLPFINRLPANQAVFAGEWSYGYYNRPLAGTAQYDDALRLARHTVELFDRYGIAWAWHHWGENWVPTPDNDILRYTGGLIADKAQALGLKA